MRKRTMLAFICFVFLSGAVSAQSKGQSADDLVRRMENVAGRWETIAARTKSVNSLANIPQNDIRTLEDDTARLNIDLQYFQAGNGTLTERQNNRLMDASRRITQAQAQIQRNLDRLKLQE